MGKLINDEAIKELIELENKVSLIKEDIERYENDLEKAIFESAMRRFKRILLQLRDDLSKDEKRLEYLRNLLKAGVN